MSKVTQTKQSQKKSELKSQRKVKKIENKTYCKQVGSLIFVYKRSFLRKLPKVSKIGQILSLWEKYDSLLCFGFIFQVA